VRRGGEEKRRGILTFLAQALRWGKGKREKKKREGKKMTGIFFNPDGVGLQRRGRGKKKKKEKGGKERGGGRSSAS